jgi:signal transduction histidine kinase
MDAETSAFWLTDVARELSGLDGALEVTLDGVLGAIDPEDRDEVLTAIEGARQTGELTRVEYRVATPGRGVRWLASSGRFHPGDSRGPAALRGVTTDITERRRSEETLRDLSQRLLQVHEAERALLARELHDDVSQRLAVLAIDVGRLEQSLTAPDHRTEMTSVRESLVRLSEDIHTLSYQLHPSVLEELGIVEALEAECERFRRQNAMPIRANLAPVDRGLALEEALCLFRVAQHALRNVLLHSAATAVNLVLRPLDGGFMLKVADNGVGFDVAAQRERRSLGLASMRERVRLVGGSIDIETEPGVGTSVSAWVPGRGGDT